LTSPRALRGLFYFLKTPYNIPYLLDGESSLSASNLVIVAHPDDETIFFGGMIHSLRKRGWKVIVVTDGNADGLGASRGEQLREACRQLGAKEVEQWDFPDIYEKRLDTAALMERFAKIEKPKAIFTHGILGEYGHPHHQDVSWAVHKTFSKKIPVWSVAYNSFPSKAIRLTRKSYEAKANVYSQIYHNETVRFARVLPVRDQEGFHRVDFDEIDHIYEYFTDKRDDVDSDKLKTYGWFVPYLAEQKKVSQKRRF
jgi:LmbE family N-acetylglucosaminyl deacetylase